MNRRNFIIAGASAVALSAIPMSPAVANPQFGGRGQQGPVDDYRIISDTTEGSIRKIVAAPSAKVCSKQIDIQVDTKTQTIVSCKFTRGCDGNAQGICSLIKGMKVKDIVSRLSGIDCAHRGTSCPDQLARILKAAGY